MEARPPLAVEGNAWQSEAVRLAFINLSPVPRSGGGDVVQLFFFFLLGRGGYSYSVRALGPASLRPSAQTQMTAKPNAVSFCSENFFKGQLLEIWEEGAAIPKEFFFFFKSQNH